MYSEAELTYRSFKTVVNAVGLVSVYAVRCGGGGQPATNFSAIL